MYLSADYMYFVSVYKNLKKGESTQQNSSVLFAAAKAYILKQ